MSDERIPNLVSVMLYDYCLNLRMYFGSKIYGVYLYNSLALGAFDMKKSDIDFVTIVNEKFTEREIRALKNIHKNLMRKFKIASKMEGMYIEKKSVGKLNSEIESYPYFADKKLNIGYYDLNYVTWWLIEKYGIDVNGPEVKELNIHISWDQLLQNMDYNLNFYWKGKIRKRFIFLTDYWIEFGVLSLCRILYTVKNREITSKCIAAKEEFNNIPDEYKLILKEALRIREDASGDSFYRSPFKREKEAKEFINYVINHCNATYFINKGSYEKKKSPIKVSVV